ncbi:MAG TPA: hypothetical protein VL475_03800, partial [Planctomycetaceae bacterium]|nr:hypothetical protein [Planctomycetaceae bacterium]
CERKFPRGKSGSFQCIGFDCGVNRWRRVRRDTLSQIPEKSEESISAKEAVRALLDRLPDDVSLEQIQYHIYVCQKIERGLEDIREGRTIPHEEVERRLKKWLQP